jgi:PhoPQ-activated pathogenicity-related protein
MILYNLTISIVIIDFLKADPLKRSRVEDELIAWTWKEFIDTNGTDPRIILYFPMTKVETNKIK